MIHTINRNVYGDLLAQHQPKAIETEAENEAAILLAESLEHRQRTPEENTLLELLIILIEKFEETSYPLPNLESDRMLLHLMEARNMKQEELVGVIGSRGVVSEIVNGKRSISKAQAKTLGELFHVSPSLFI
ncbi:type II toxin-antitoxin system HigA family antitoxin [Chamaesiphon sp.]|uniref:helix-turn-helix domain-containing protein n=1 Tax=Chamaesiphon sp. TaxID=2814140 RepID=UPI0035941B64